MKEWPPPLGLPIAAFEYLPQETFVLSHQRRSLLNSWLIFSSDNESTSSENHPATSLNCLTVEFWRPKRYSSGEQCYNTLSRCRGFDRRLGGHSLWCLELDGRSLPLLWLLMARFEAEVPSRSGIAKAGAGPQLRVSSLGLKIFHSVSSSFFASEL